MKQNRYLLLLCAGLLCATLAMVVTAPLRSTPVHAAQAAVWQNTGSLLRTPSVEVTLPSDGRVLEVGVDAELYNPTTGVWTQAPLPPLSGSNTATVLHNGLVLVVVGSNAELYHPQTGTWSLTGSLHYAHGVQTATLLADGRVLVVGSAVANTELYDPQTGTWSLTGSINTSRWGYTATLLTNGRVLVTGASILIHLLL